jgi:hypothetical protein
LGQSGTATGDGTMILFSIYVNRAMIVRDSVRLSGSLPGMDPFQRA